MAETVYNVTISNTSPILTYSPYVVGNASSGGWQSACPTCVPYRGDDLSMCDPDSAHTTSSYDASFQLSFEGVGIYLLGNTTNNLGYDITLDSVQSPGNPRTDLGLLYSATGLEPGSHSVTLTVRQPASTSNPGSVTFKEAVVSAGTGLTGATMSKKVLDDGDSTITYYASRGGEWTIEDIYPESIGPDGSTTFHDSCWTNASATVKFQGNGIAVYGACCSRSPYAAYAASMDGATEISYNEAFNLHSGDEIQTAGNCLRYFKAGLDGSKEHTLVLRVKEAGRMVVDWVEVFSASGGTPIDGGRAPSGGPNLPSSYSNSKIRIIAGATTGGVVLASALLTFFFCFRRRKRDQYNQPQNTLTSPTQGMTQTGSAAIALDMLPVKPSRPHPRPLAPHRTNDPSAAGTRTSLVSSSAPLMSSDLSSLSTYSGPISALGWPESVANRNGSYNSMASADTGGNLKPVELSSTAAISGPSWTAGSSVMAVEGGPSVPSVASGWHHNNNQIGGTAPFAPSAPPVDSQAQ